MNAIRQDLTSLRLVYPPPPTDTSLPASIFCLEIREEFEVEWQWTNLPDGNRVVTDYKLFLRPESSSAIET